MARGSQHSAPCPSHMPMPAQRARVKAGVPARCPFAGSGPLLGSPLARKPCARLQFYGLGCAGSPSLTTRPPHPSPVLPALLSHLHGAARQPDVTASAGSEWLGVFHTCTLSLCPRAAGAGTSGPPPKGPGKVSPRRTLLTWGYICGPLPASVIWVILERATGEAGQLRGWEPWH